MYVAIYINEEGTKEVWSDIKNNMSNALEQGEEFLYSTFGSRDPRFLKRVKCLIAVDPKNLN